MEVDDVAGLHQASEVAGAVLQRLLVEVPLLLAQLAAVAGIAVEVVVEALGDGEELRPLAQDDPAGVDAGPAHVGQHRLQHLRHAAAALGRVDVPDRPAREGVPGTLGDPLEPLVLRPEQGPVPLERLGCDLDEFRVHQALKRR